MKLGKCPFLAKLLKLFCTKHNISVVDDDESPPIEETSEPIEETPAPIEETPAPEPIEETPAPIDVS